MNATEGIVQLPLNCPRSRSVKIRNFLSNRTCRYCLLLNTRGSLVDRRASTQTMVSLFSKYFSLLTHSRNHFPKCIPKVKKFHYASIPCIRIGIYWNNFSFFIEMCPDIFLSHIQHMCSIQDQMFDETERVSVDVVLLHP